MGNSRFIIALTVITIGCVAAGPSAARASRSSHHSGATRQPLQFRAISFADHLHGWVSAFRSYRDYLLHTVDGGHTWVRYPVTFRATQMQFIDARQGWAIGTRGTCNSPSARCRSVIAYTSDGGRTWTWWQPTPGCRQLSSLDFITANDGWAIEGNGPCLTQPSQQPISRVIRTVDGGRSWHVALSLPVVAGSVHFGDRLHGWFAGGGVGTNHCSTTVFQTTDGGVRWAREFHLAGYCSPSIDFVDAQHGWLLATNWGMCSMGGCYDNRLYVSRDGGQHWTLEQSAHLPRLPALWSGPSGFLGGVVFVTPEVGYIPVSEGAGPGQGGIDITRDGGRHWIRKQPYRLGVLSLSPVNASEAWAIGGTQGGCKPGAACTSLLHTTNAGRTWGIMRIMVPTLNGGASAAAPYHAPSRPARPPRG